MPTIDNTSTTETENETDLAEALPKQATRHQGQNDQRVEHALQTHQGQILPSLFNRRERQAVQSHLASELIQGFEHRREALSMVLETRLHSVREACNHVLVTGKTQLRQERIEYFASVYRNVERQMSAITDEFLADMDSRFNNLQSLSTPILRDREQQRLERSVDQFLGTLDDLLAEFRSIISESVSHQPQKSTLRENDNEA